MRLVRKPVISKQKVRKFARIRLQKKKERKKERKKIHRIAQIGKKRFQNRVLA